MAQRVRKSLPNITTFHAGRRLIVIAGMASFRLFPAGPRVVIALTISAICATIWADRVGAQSPAQIGTNSPLPVFVTNPPGALMLPEGFVAGSQWRFTTWTMPSVLTWTATVNRTNGPWAQLTITTEDRATSTRWYYVPAMPGSWERQ